MTAEHKISFILGIVVGFLLSALIVAFTQNMSAAEYCDDFGGTYVQDAKVYGEDEPKWECVIK